MLFSRYSKNSSFSIFYIVFICSSSFGSFFSSFFILLFILSLFRIGIISFLWKICLALIVGSTIYLPYFLLFSISLQILSPFKCGLYLICCSPGSNKWFTYELLILVTSLFLSYSVISLILFPNTFHNLFDGVNFN